MKKLFSIFILLSCGCVRAELRYSGGTYAENLTLRSEISAGDAALQSQINAVELAAVQNNNGTVTNLTIKAPASVGWLDPLPGLFIEGFAESPDIVFAGAGDAAANGVYHNDGVFGAVGWTNATGYALRSIPDVYGPFQEGIQGGYEMGSNAGSFVRKYTTGSSINTADMRDGLTWHVGGGAAPAPTSTEQINKIATIRSDGTINIESPFTVQGESLVTATDFNNLADGALLASNSAPVVLETTGSYMKFKVGESFGAFSVEFDGVSAFSLNSGSAVLPAINCLGGLFCADDPAVGGEVGNRDYNDARYLQRSEGLTTNITINTTTLYITNGLIHAVN